MALPLACAPAVLPPSPLLLLPWRWRIDLSPPPDSRKIVTAAQRRRRYTLAPLPRRGTRRYGVSTRHRQSWFSLARPVFHVQTRILKTSSFFVSATLAPARAWQGLLHSSSTPSSTLFLSDPSSERWQAAREADDPRLCLYPSLPLPLPLHSGPPRAPTLKPTNDNPPLGRLKPLPPPLWRAPAPASRALAHICGPTRIMR